MDFKKLAVVMDRHPFVHPSNQPLFEAFEQKLAGKKGEMVVLFYANKQGTFFRFGYLEGEKLVYDPTTLITLPVFEFWTGPEGAYKDLGIAFDRKVSVHKANIFSQRVDGLDHYPTLLGNYILGDERVARQVEPLPSSLQLFVGNEEANRYFKEHEDTDLEPSEWMKNLAKNGPGPDFLGALKLTDEELAASGDNL